MIDAKIILSSPVVRCGDIGGNEMLLGECSHGNLHGSTCRFSCPVGHNVIGSHVITCLRNAESDVGAWNSSLPSCQSMY